MDWNSDMKLPSEIREWTLRQRMIGWTALHATSVVHAISEWADGIWMALLPWAEAYETARRDTSHD